MTLIFEPAVGKDIIKSIHIIISLSELTLEDYGLLFNGEVLYINPKSQAEDVYREYQKGLK